jgi:hypothetical protein
MDQRGGNQWADRQGGPIGISRHILDGILSPMRIAIAIGIWPQIPMLLLAAIWMGWVSPVWADSPRYRSTNGFVVLEFDRSLRAPLGVEPLLGQFVNQTPGEHWIGTLQLEPVHTVGSDGLTSMHGRFRDFSPGTEPLVVCTGDCRSGGGPSARTDDRTNDRTNDRTAVSTVSAGGSVQDYRWAALSGDAGGCLHGQFCGPRPAAALNAGS